MKVSSLEQTHLLGPAGPLGQLFCIKLLSTQILAVCALVDSISFRIGLADFLSANAGT